MPFLCCGVKYSVTDPETYWCIDTDVVSVPTKKKIDNRKIVKEVVETLNCKKNGCTKVQIARYFRLKGELHIAEFEELKGRQAQDYLEKTSKLRIRQPQKCPVVNVPTLSKNDFVYGKVINSETQRIRYLNEQGWASDKKIISKVKYL